MDKRIKTIMSIIFEIPVDEINEKTSKETVKNWDSLKQMDLVVALEEDFSIEFNDDEIITLDSFSAIKKILGKKMDEIN